MWEGAFYPALLAVLKNQNAPENSMHTTFGLLNYWPMLCPRWPFFLFHLAWSARTLPWVYRFTTFKVHPETSKTVPPLINLFSNFHGKWQLYKGLPCLQSHSGNHLLHYWEMQALLKTMIHSCRHSLFPEQQSKTEQWQVGGCGEQWIKTPQVWA